MHSASLGEALGESNECNPKAPKAVQATRSPSPPHAHSICPQGTMKYHFYSWKPLSPLPATVKERSPVSVCGVWH